MDKDVLLEGSKLSLEVESGSDEGIVKIVERTTKGLVYYINLVNKAVTGFERISFENFKCR